MTKQAQIYPAGEPTAGTSPIGQGTIFVPPETFYDKALTGGQRSLLNLHLLRFNRDLGAVKVSQVQMGGLITGCPW